MKTILALVAIATLSGCASLTGSNQQYLDQCRREAWYDKCMAQAGGTNAGWGSAGPVCMNQSVTMSYRMRSEIPDECRGPAKNGA